MSTGIIYSAMQRYASVMESVRPGSSFRTTYRVMFVSGVYDAPKGGLILHNTINSKIDLDFSSSLTLSETQAGRYGPGAGSPIEQDLSVLPAISVKPDRIHALYGLGLEEGTEWPNEIALAVLGGKLDAQDQRDLQACPDFGELVVGCLNRGIPVGTPRSQWPQPPAWVSPAPPPNSTPVRTPFDSSNQGVGQAGAQSNVQQSAPPSLAALSLADLQNLVAQSVAQAIGQAVPVLIQAEIGRLVPTSPSPAMPSTSPTSVTVPTSVPPLPTGTPGPTPIPAEVVVPASTTATAALKAQLATANQTLASINDALRGLAIAPTGGGKPMVALRKIAAIMQSANVK